MSQQILRESFAVLADFHFRTVLVSVEKTRGSKLSLQFELYGVVTGYPPNIPIMDALARFLGIG
jgi:hypothetical protein